MRYIVKPVSASPAGLVISEASKKVEKAVVAGGKKLSRKAADWWKNPKFRKGTYIAVSVAGGIIVALIVVAVVTHRTPEEAAIGKAIGNVKTFLQYRSKKIINQVKEAIDN